MAKLCINLDHVATIRQARQTIEPDPVGAAVLAELGGADGITIHLREDRRHIQDRDLKLMRQIVKTKLNLEMAAVDEIIRIALEVKPDQVTLVPEKRKEITTEGGLSVVLQKDLLKKTINRFHQAQIPVSLFVDPSENEILASAAIGSDYIEINTAKYSESKNQNEEKLELEKINQAIKIASNLKLKINAGHGLTFRNIGRLAVIKEIEEFNIGHNIVARAVMVGMEIAVRDMKALIQANGH